MRQFKTQHGARYYLRPSTIPPSRVYDCIKCDLPVRISGEWNETAGRWLMAFTCEKCGTHQEGFVSELKDASKKKRTNLPFKERALSDDE